MNKIIFPSILATTLLVAGMFAFMPVERASTVHTTIGSAITSVAIGSSIPQAANDLYLVADTTPRTSVNGHIAIQVPCDDDAGDFDLAFRLLEGDATVALTAKTLTFVAVVHDGADTNDVFDALCVAHADLTNDGPDFVLENQTDEAGIGDGVGEAVSLEGSSITIRAT